MKYPKASKWVLVKTWFIGLFYDEAKAHLEVYLIGQKIHYLLEQGVRPDSVSITDLSLKLVDLHPRVSLEHKGRIVEVCLALDAYVIEQEQKDAEPN